MKIIINNEELKLLKDLVADEYFDLVRHCSECACRLSSSDLSEDHRQFYHRELLKSFSKAFDFNKILNKLDKLGD